MTKKAFFAADTTVIPTTIVTYYMNNISNKELIIKTQAIFEAFYKTTQDPYLAAAMEKLSGVWYLK